MNGVALPVREVTRTALPAVQASVVERPISASEQ